MIKGQNAKALFVLLLGHPKVPKHLSYKHSASSYNMPPFPPLLGSHMKQVSQEINTEPAADANWQ